MNNQIEPAKVNKVADTVTYADNSVVSRAIVKKGTGNVTLFAFDKGEALSEHTAPFDALVCVIDGSAEIRIGGKPHEVKSGEMILMPANIPHAVNAVEKFKMMLVMIKSN